MKDRWLLLRGLTRGVGHWGDFPEILKVQNKNIEVELLDIPGNGEWNKCETPTDPIEMIAMLRAKCNFLNTKDPIHLLGVSLGGMISLKWADLYPNEIKSVVVVNSSSAQDSKFYQRLLPQNYSQLLKLLFQKDDKVRESGVLEIVSNRSERRLQFLKQFAEFSFNYPIRRKNFFNQLKLANNIRFSKTLNVPVKILYSLHDRLVSPQCSINLAKRFGIEPLRHDTAGHDLPLDDPQWLCEMILKK